MLAVYGKLREWRGTLALCCNKQSLCAVMDCVAVGQRHLLSYVVWLNFDRASKRRGSRGSAQKVEMVSQIGKLGAAMEERELAALASVKNPYRIKQQSLVVKNGKSVQQLAWKNAGAVADPNVFNHPVHVYTSSMHVVTANTCATSCAGVGRVERGACACSHALPS